MVGARTAFFISACTVSHHGAVLGATGRRHRLFRGGLVDELLEMRVGVPSPPSHPRPSAGVISSAAGLRHHGTSFWRWASYASATPRVIRGFARQREMNYVKNAPARASHLRIMLVHILPSHPAGAAAGAGRIGFNNAVLAASMSFGHWCQPPEVFSAGYMMSSPRHHMVRAPVVYAHLRQLSSTLAVLGVEASSARACSRRNGEVAPCWRSGPSCAVPYLRPRGGTGHRPDRCNRTARSWGWWANPAPAPEP